MSDQLVSTSSGALRAEHDSYVDWGAILAGGVLSAAVAFVLLTFGAALGLSISSVFQGTGMSLTFYIIAIGLWFVWVQVTSVIIGAYIAGRLRRRLYDATEHEVHVRDGSHGLIVWAIATTLGALMAVSSIGSAVSTGASVASSGISSIVSGVSNGSRNAKIDPVALTRNAMDYSLDVLFRPSAIVTGQSAAPGTPVPGRTVFNAEARNEVLRVLAKTGTKGDITDADKQYVAQVVMRETGVSEAQAKQRVEFLLQARNETVAKAASLGEQARKMGIILALVTAVSLLLAAAAGWWAAATGGNHRDQELAFPLLIWRR